MRHKRLRRGSNNTQKNCTKKFLMTGITQWCDHLLRARQPRVWSQVGLRKLYYEQVTGGHRIPAELLKILHDDAVKVLHTVCQWILKTQH